MGDRGAIDALLAAAKPEPTLLPPAEERRRLREELHLSRAQLAAALGVSASTVGGWESGREPGGELRENYAYFLEGAAAKLGHTAETAAAPADVPATEPGDEADQADVLDGVDELVVPQPCVLCGQPARHQVEGFPQHLDPAECGSAEPAPASAAAPAVVTAEPEPSAPPVQPARSQAVPRQRPGKPARAGWQGGRAAAGRGVKVAPVGRRVQAASDIPDPIGSAVTAVLEEHRGDVEAATAALVKRAIPDAMALLDHTRKGGRYDVVAHPWLPDVLRKQTTRGADQVWEARPKWTRPEL
ncbi:helix-turn-helix transcriptional regulator, partial [Streptomyces sp. NPDC004589]|uniref:helix-turn-helix domain-containing protein n=1 Tax=Streptomyces sp. NPDC004589 TaxID=3154553 RepID=UPI0033A947FD